MTYKSPPEVLLHICCAVCASETIRRLRAENFAVTGYFYNPNIHPRSEYRRRLNEVRRLSRKLGFRLIEGKCDSDQWFINTHGLEGEPEGGRRCALCFEMRLKETSRYACKQVFPHFTSTLTISPHKNAELINSLGCAIGGEFYLGGDFKKQDGFKKAIDFAKKHNLYRQHYCGCVYSMKKAVSNK